MSPTKRVRVILPGGDAAWVAGRATDSVIEATEAAAGRYEAHLQDLMAQVVPPDAVAVDAGANVGIHALALATLASEGRVYAFEPASTTFEYLVANVEEAGAGRVTPVRAALTDRTGATVLSMRDEHPGGAAVTTRSHFGPRREPVESMRLDEWFEGEGIERLDVLKVDVEGSEALTLRGARRVLERYRPDLFVEFNPTALQRTAGTAPRDLFRVLFHHYPFVAVIRERGHLDRVRCWADLWGVLEREAIVDLYCTHRRGGSPWQERARGRVVQAVRGTRRAVWRSFATCPERAFVFEPSYRLAPRTSHLTLTPGGRASLPVKLANTSPFWLSGRFENGGVALSYHWLDDRGNLVEFEGLRTPLGAGLRPHHSTTLDVLVEAPPDAGRYTLSLSLVQEGFMWATDLDPRLAVDIPATVS